MAATDAGLRTGSDPENCQESLRVKQKERRCSLKDLRNAIAHNAVVFDTRFRNIDPTPAMKRCLIQDIGLPYVNFKTIGDYIILMSYYLHLLKVPKTEIKAFIRDFEKITTEYRNSVNPGIASMVLHPVWPARMTALKNFL